MQGPAAIASSVPEKTNVPTSSIWGLALAAASGKHAVPAGANSGNDQGRQEQHQSAAQNPSSEQSHGKDADAGAPASKQELESALDLLYAS